MFQAVALEHTLRSELRNLREEMEENSFSRSISSARVDSLQAEVMSQSHNTYCAHSHETSCQGDDTGKMFNIYFKLWNVFSLLSTLYLNTLK